MKLLVAHLAYQRRKDTCQVKSTARMDALTACDQWETSTQRKLDGAKSNPLVRQSHVELTECREGAEKRAAYITFEEESRLAEPFSQLSDI